MHRTCSWTNSSRRRRDCRRRTASGAVTTPSPQRVDDATRRAAVASTSVTIVALLAGGHDAVAAGGQRAVAVAAVAVRAVAVVALLLSLDRTVPAVFLQQHRSTPTPCCRPGNPSGRRRSTRRPSHSIGDSGSPQRLLAALMPPVPSPRATFIFSPGPMPGPARNVEMSVAVDVRGVDRELKHLGTGYCADKVNPPLPSPSSTSTNERVKFVGPPTGAGRKRRGRCGRPRRNRRRPGRRRVGW